MTGSRPAPGSRLCSIPMGGDGVSRLTPNPNSTFEGEIVDSSLRVHP